MIERVKLDGIKLNYGNVSYYDGVLSNCSPSISWEFKIAEKNWYQQSYSLQIKRGDGTVEICDADSSESNNIAWPAKPLKSREAIQIRIKVVGTSGEESKWSKWGTIRVGILDWKAPFIALKDQEPASNIAPETLFRSPKFQISKKVKSASVHSTALGVYEVYINSSKISDDYLAPGWTSYNHRVLHQVYDVTHLLEENFVIGARVGAGWFSGNLGFSGGNINIYGHHRAISLELNIEYEDGSVEVIETSTKWVGNSGPIVSSQLYHGETYDATLEVKDWCSPSATDEWQPTETVQYSGKVKPQDFGYIRVVDRLKPVEIFTTKSGKTIADFGQNSVGFLQLKNIQGTRGHKITIILAEVMEHGELGIRPLRRAKATDSYILSGEGNEEYTPRFTYHGFRYVQVENWPTDLSPDQLELQVIGSSLEEIGTFECSNKLVNKLYQNVFQSTRGNFVSIPTDCPQRDERMGWLGDIAVFAPTALYMFDAYPFLRSWMEDVKLEQGDNGGFPSVVVPDIVTSYKHHWMGKFSAIWQDACVIVPQRLFEATNNADILKAQYDSAKTWYEFIPKIPGKVRWDKIQLQLGDWLDPTAPPDNPALAVTDPYLVADAFLYLILTQLQEISARLNYKKDEEKFATLKSQCYSDFRDAYLDSLGTQTGYSLAITFGLLKDDEIQEAGEKLVDLIERNDYKIGTGFAGTPYITEALVLANKPDTAYKLLLNEKNPSWLYPVTMGATTVWERWDSMLPNGDINPGEMTSFNHYALGAVAAWLHERVGGIRRMSPGWSEVEFQPIVGGGITHAKTSHRSPNGWLKSSWKIESGIFLYEVEIPPNTRARIILPNGEIFERGSGCYTFDVT